MCATECSLIDSARVYSTVFRQIRIVRSAAHLKLCSRSVLPRHPEIKLATLSTGRRD